MEPDYSLIGTGIDLRQVDPISQKRLLAFFNFWLLQTVRFMNDFASQVESKLLEVDNRLRRLEASMTLLEAKLASIPGLDSDQLAPRTSANAVQRNETASVDPTKEEKENKSPAVNTVKPEESATALVASSEVGTSRNEEISSAEAQQYDPSKDPRYAKYFKMLQLGVPENAVKQKMELEGVDPSVLLKTGPKTSQISQETAGKPQKQNRKDDDDSESFGESDESSFSD